MKFSLEEITPEEAATLLERVDSRQRRISQRVVDCFAKDMEGGQWRLNHQPIATNSSGELIDGQHRLWAVVQSGRTVQMWVARGFEEYRTVDNGRLRTSGQVLGLPEHYVSMARRMLMGCDLSNRRISNAAMEEFISTHKGSLDWTYRELGTGGSDTKRAGRLNANAPIRAAVARAYYYEDLGRLLQFCTIFRLGFNVDGSLTADDRAAVVLRTIVARGDALVGGQKASVHLYKLAETAIRSFCTRLPRSLLREHDDELYPLPDDPGGTP
jgi:hypothetical protein